MASLLGTIFVFVLIIGLHEFGHFGMAKLVGIRVNEYSIGMGPLLYKKQKDETQYSIRALPLGGYVAMEGEEDESDDPRSFNNAGLPQRAAVIASGAAMNFVLAIVGFTLFTLISGYPTNTVGEVLPGTPAATAGIKKGDVLLSVNSEPVKEWNEFSALIAESKEDVTVGYSRSGEEQEITIKPAAKDGRRYIGIKPESEHHPLRSVKDGFTMTGKVIVTIFDVLKQLFTGDLGVDKLSGPVGVVKIIGDSAKFGFGSLMFIMAYISANLGVMNLLPIPALDGGKLLFILIEAITGRPVDKKVEMTLSFISFALLIGLMIYVTIFGDIARFLN